MARETESAAHSAWDVGEAQPFKRGSGTGRIHSNTSTIAILRFSSQKQFLLVLILLFQYLFLAVFLPPLLIPAGGLSFSCWSPYIDPTLEDEMKDRIIATFRILRPLGLTSFP